MRGKFGWSLPPGVTHLPGEEPGAEALEELTDRILDALEPIASYGPGGEENEEKLDRAVNNLIELITDEVRKAEDNLMREMKLSRGEC